MYVMCSLKYCHDDFVVQESRSEALKHKRVNWNYNANVKLITRTKAHSSFARNFFSFILYVLRKQTCTYVVRKHVILFRFKSDLWSWSSRAWIGIINFNVHKTISRGWKRMWTSLLVIGSFDIKSAHSPDRQLIAGCWWLYYLHLTLYIKT